MTKRDGDTEGKMAKLDKIENCRRKSPAKADNSRDFSDNSEIHSPGKHSSSARLSSGSFSECSSISFRDSPRSAPSSLPGSRCGSTPGSRLASRSNSQESIIDLFDSMTLQFGQQLGESQGLGIQLFSPKPRPLRHPKWSWQERVRVNHAIWRSWHMQYVKGKKPVICHFSAPAPEARQRLQADVIQGRPINKQWNPTQISSAIRDYHKWRVFGRDIFMGESAVRNPEDNAIDLDMPHPPLSPMSAQKLINDDLLKDFSDTLFISTEKKNFTVPAPRKITRHVYNSDIIQPGLMQLEPDFDQDFMDTLDSLQDILCKTPTKNDIDHLSSADNLPCNFLSDSSLGSFNDAMEIADNNKMISSSASYPVAIIANSNRQGTNQRSVTFAAPPAPAMSTAYDPMISSGNFTGIGQLYFNNSGVPSSGSNTQSTSALSGIMPLSNSNLGQSNNFMQSVTGNYSNRHSPQRSTSMVTTSLQTSLTSGHVPAITAVSSIPSPQSSVPSPQSSLPSPQGYTMPHPKLEAQSPTPTSPPPCSHGVPARHAASPSASNPMGVISEAIDMLTCQMPMSPSKIIPPLEWNLPMSQANMNWGVNVSGAVGGSLATLKNSMASANFAPDLSYSLDPMAPMDQNTVLGHRNYSGEMSQLQQHQQHQQQQQHQPQQQQQQQQQRMGSEYGGAMGRYPDLPQQAAEELMEYEQLTLMGDVAANGTGVGAYRQPKREVTYSSRSNSRPSSRANSRANSRTNSRASSPRTSYAGQPFQESLQAAFQGKSDAKDRGMLSPSAERDIAVSIPSSSHASTASSAASSPGSQLDYPDTPTSSREYEFHAPKPKRQKTPDSNSKDKETRRRLKHLHSEHKRRFNIQSGLDELQTLIPGMASSSNDNSSKVSTASMLQKAHEYILHLKEETNTLRNEVEKTKEEITKINDEICECQDSLPDTGAPVSSQSERQLQQMCNDYIQQQMNDNWKFWIFSMMVRPLFASYVTAVCTSPGCNFDAQVVDWVEENCRLKLLRKTVYNIVRQISTRTSVLQNPSQLPQQVRDIIKQESETPSQDQS